MKKEPIQPKIRNRFVRFFSPGLTKPLTKTDLEARALEEQRLSEQFWGTPTDDINPEENRKRLVTEARELRGSSHRIGRELSRLERFPETYPQPFVLTESDIQFIAPDFPDTSVEELERLVFENNPDIYAARLVQTALLSIAEQSNSAQQALQVKAEKVEEEKTSLYATQPPTFPEWSIDNLPWYAAVKQPDEPTSSTSKTTLPPISRFDNISPNVDLEKINATTRMGMLIKEARQKGGFVSFNTKDGAIHLPQDEDVRTEFIATLQILNNK